MPLSGNSYGKSKVRITKVVRDGTFHKLFEIDAAIQLEGDFERVYTHGDNSNCIATDSMKNTVYVVAKEQPFTTIEQFASLLASHFVNIYPQVSRATVELKQANWQRIEVSGKPHDHAFTSGGSDERVARCVVTRGASAEAWGGVSNLRVLKTTNSQWHTFVADRYRTLPDSYDRILATQIDAVWRYVSTTSDFDRETTAIRRAILETFADHASLGVQQTLLAMGDAALAASGAIDRIDFSLPNLHRIPFNLAPFGLKFENDIYVATDEPHGLITGSVSGKGDMAKLSTHVLDTSTGKPAAGMRVELFWVEPDGDPDVRIRSTVTNQDGRTEGPMLEGERMSAGTYKLVFHVGEYFAHLNHPDAKRFLDCVPLVFIIEDATQGYHVPLLVSPWAYSTYRGS